MDNYPQKLIEQYLKSSQKLKKFDRVVFKRFAPNVTEVLDEFARLAHKFEEAGIYQYAAMCHLGVAKCELSVGNAINECQSYLKAARAFLCAYNANAALLLRSCSAEYKEGALRCYCQALERCTDDTVLKAAIIREMTPLQPQYEGCSSFSSPAHRIQELELAAHCCLEHNDFLGALQQLDDIVDNICERKQQLLYEELLKRVEIQRVFLLMTLNLPPARQSPSHIKLIEYYERLGNFEEIIKKSPVKSDACMSNDLLLAEEMHYELAELVIAWKERRTTDLKLLLQQFICKHKTLNVAQQNVVQSILNKTD